MNKRLLLGDIEYLTNGNRIELDSINEIIIVTLEDKGYTTKVSKEEM